MAELNNHEEMSELSNNDGKSEIHVYNHDMFLTVPEMMILGVLMVFMMTSLVLCLDGTRCLQKMIDERKKLKKALQYQPSEDLSRVDPLPGENKVDCAITEGIAKDTEGHIIPVMENNNFKNV